jgi:DNA helicase II / ATP-dependent DNA helicase PcrA
MKDGVVQSFISNAKAKSLTPSDTSVEAEKAHDDVKRIMAEIYAEYEITLKKNNCLDFDDLLVYGVKLFKKAPHVLQTIQHILVDEL